MRINKLLLLSTILVLTTPAIGQTLISDMEFPKTPAYRVGISDTPEVQYVEIRQDETNFEQLKVKTENQTDTYISDMTYADLTIKRLSKEIAQELQYEEKDMVADLSLLWQGAAVQSDTINFALYKLANPDADKPDEKSIKNVLKTIASMSTLVGAGIGSPVLAGASLMGGNIFGIMSQDTKALNYKYTRVNDADMIILIRKVEDLQQKAVDLYYDYMSAKKQLEFANELVADRQNKFNLAQKNNAPRELIVITDAYYRTALDRQRNAQAEFFSKRATLEQFVGNETFLQFEAELVAREKGENARAEETVNEEYNQTVKNVSDFVQNDEISQDTVAPLPQLRSLDIDYDTDVTTGFSSNIEDSNEQDDIANAEDKITDDKKTKRKQKKVKEKKNKRQKKVKEQTLNKTEQSAKKYPKNSTKDLIFLHGADKTTVKSTLKDKIQSTLDSVFPVENGETTNSIPPSSKPAPVQNSFGFMPLDEIKAPELHTGGYSIHSEYNEVNSSEIRTFQY